MLVAMVPALRKIPVLPGLVILGDLSIQGNIKPVNTLAEQLQIVMGNGARRALIP
jgi:ATP-dependent Lon protease